MLIKLGIIGAILVLGGLIFSSEINGLFPNTSASIIESLKDDVNNVGTKTSESVENRLDTSIDKVVEKTSVQINDGINNARESSKNVLSNELIKINPIETIGNVFKNKPTKSNEESEKSKSTTEHFDKQTTLENNSIKTNTETIVYETLSLSTIKQSNDNILLRYSDSTGKTESVSVTIRTADKEIFSGTFYTPMFETIINNSSETPYYVDMIVEHQDYGTVSSSVFNPGDHSDTTINGIFSKL